MPNYVTLPTPNKNWWEPAAQQAGNFLWQMGMMNVARQQRMQEAMLNRISEQEQAARGVEAKLALSGYQEMPEGSTAEPGVVNVGASCTSRPSQLP